MAVLYWQPKTLPVIHVDNNFNRYDYLYNPYSLSSGDYYYNPYTGYYRPLNSYNNQTTRFYYENILVLSISKTGKVAMEQGNTQKPV